MQWHKGPKGGLSWNVINILLSADFCTEMSHLLEKLCLIADQVFC